ncbi:efflux RND transporter periplasmic adaptor subunit [Robertkochia aurantiaca]|uniref:efflux RND transporter periplasmic adaptor subunit n=1 Tax=Robertkochia aurantiaca TaxID=2873700 RepID=UPI001CCED7C9|nr:efflux RND transporter periplasmic adaptor subunit [Robertkochia sp. 3YJGBD-33]
MKKNLLYGLIALIIGLMAGYFIFGSSEKTIPEEAAETETAQMWTCSMHPQIMQPEPGDCPICGMDLIPAEQGEEGLSAEQFTLTETAMALADIRTLKLDAGSAGERSVELTGKIRENEEMNKIQASYFAGRIEDLRVNSTGETVRKGQLLATIYSPELVAAQQELITSASMRNSQPELYRAVRKKLKLWKLTELQIAEIEESGKVKEYFPIYATVSGTITEKLVQEGDYVKEGQPLFRIADLSSVWAVFDAYENQSSLLEEGQPITLATKAFPNDSIIATIDFIDPLMNTATRTISVRVELKNDQKRLKPGMFVSGEVELQHASDESGLYIPSSAILWTGERSVVYVKTDPEKAVFEMREVRLGPSAGERELVLSGLNSGDEIVVNGTFTVDAAAQLQGKPSMMNQTENGSEGDDFQVRTDLPEINAENVPEAFRNDFEKLLSKYMDLTKALSSDKANEAGDAAETLNAILERMNDKTGVKEAEEFWKKTRSDLSLHLKNLQQAESIEAQRREFQSVSSLMIEAAKTFGVKNMVYQQYCPMANNNQGAYWLSFSKEIENPYFGASMHKCGETSEMIEPY